MNKPSELLSPDSMDDYGLQRQRIIWAAKSLCPSCTVTFDATRAPGIAPIPNRKIAQRDPDSKPNPEYPVSVVAKWPEEELVKDD